MRAALGVRFSKGEMRRADGNVVAGRQRVLARETLPVHVGAVCRTEIKDLARSSLTVIRAW